MKTATLLDSTYIAYMLMKMYEELDVADTIFDIKLFTELSKQYIKSSVVLYDHRGFFIMKDETPIVKRTKLWNGIAVYIFPEFRNGTTLKDYYQYMFDNFPGIIMGYTEANSLHNKVLLKRHKLLGYVYELSRS